MESASLERSIDAGETTEAGVVVMKKTILIIFVLGVIFCSSQKAWSTAMYEGIMLARVISIEGQEDALKKCVLQVIASKTTGGHVSQPDPEFTYYDPPREITRDMELPPDVVPGDIIAISWRRIVDPPHRWVS